MSTPRSPKRKQLPWRRWGRAEGDSNGGAATKNMDTKNMKKGRTLAELVLEVDRQAETNQDFEMPANRMTVDAIGGMEELELEGYGTFRMRETAHGHLAELVGIPKAYYDRMREEAPLLFANSVNHWLSLNESQRFVRTAEGAVRAVLSGKYRPLDNAPLVQVTLPALQQRGFKIVSAEVTERKLYLKAVLPKLEDEVKVGDVVQFGLAITNSEIGHGSLRIDPLLYFLACDNGAQLLDSRVKKFHVGRGTGDLEHARQFFSAGTQAREDELFWLQIGDVVQGTTSVDYFRKQVEKLRAAAADRIEGDPVGVVEVAAKRYRLTDAERNATLTHFLSGYNGQSELTRYGLMQAITAASQAPEMAYGRSSELEQLGGVILELPRYEWLTLAAGRA